MYEDEPPSMKDEEDDEESKGEGNCHQVQISNLDDLSQGEQEDRCLPQENDEEEDKEQEPMRAHHPDDGDEDQEVDEEALQFKGFSPQNKHKAGQQPGY